MSRNQNQSGQGAKLVVKGDEEKAEGKGQNERTYASGNADPTKVVDMEGDDTFERRYHPNDMGIAEIQQKKAESLETLLNKRVSEGANPTAERRELEKAFQRLEIANLSLIDTAQRQAALAAKFETLGIVQAVEAVSALLIASGLNGVESASQKMATAVRILKEANGIPLHADAMQPPEKT